MATRTVYYATNRRHIGDVDAPSGYSGRPNVNGIENLRVGEVSFTTEPREADRHLTKASRLGVGDGNALAKYYRGCLRRTGRVRQYAERIFGPDERILPAAEQTLGSRELFAGVRAAMADHCDVVIYVHGYSVGWTAAVAAAAALEDMLNRNLGVGDKRARVVLFTWPSDGRKVPWLSYASDHKDATDSGLALGRGILKLRDYLAGLAPSDFCGRQLHLLAHSIGCEVVHAAQDRFARFHGARPLPRLLENVFLCAPDVDDDVFDHDGDGGPMTPLLELSHYVSIYYNRGDLVLAVSDATKANPNRLGVDGVGRPDRLHARLHQIDCSSLVDGFTEHSYHLVGRALDDIRQSLDDVPPDSDARSRRPGPGRNSWRLT